MRDSRKILAFHFHKYIFFFYKKFIWLSLKCIQRFLYCALIYIRFLALRYPVYSLNHVSGFYKKNTKKKIIKNNWKPISVFILYNHFSKIIINRTIKKCVGESTTFKEHGNIYHETTRSNNRIKCRYRQLQIGYRIATL